MPQLLSFIVDWIKNLRVWTIVPGHISEEQQLEHGFVQLIILLNVPMPALLSSPSQSAHTFSYLPPLGYNLLTLTLETPVAVYLLFLPSPTSPHIYDRVLHMVLCSLLVMACCFFVTQSMEIVICSPSTKLPLCYGHMSHSLPLFYQVLPNIIT